MSYLTLENVQKRFGEFHAVQDFNLSASKGEFVSFLGPSGCGKTTTLRMIAGFEQPTTGTISIDGQDVTRIPPNRRNVGMVFQSYALFPNMNVADNIGFGLKVRKRPAEQIKKRVAELLDTVNLPDKGTRYPYQLSGGQQQRVALARALAFEPQVLLLDEFNEPTLKLPKLEDTVTVNFPQDGPLVLDPKAPVESVEALIAEA